MILAGKIVGLLSLAFGVSQTALSQVGTLAPQGHRWPNIDLNVLVVDKSGQPQAPSTESAIHSLKTDRSVHLKRSPRGDVPVSLALLIDTSGSTYGNRNTIRAVATAVIGSLPPKSEVMAVLFAEKAYIDLPFTPAQPAPLTFLSLLDPQRTNGVL